MRVFVWSFFMLMIILMLTSCCKRDPWEGRVDYGAHGVTGY